ncbi:U-box domain-containing protein 4-like [Aristolochia californica]|uniref:U-box domain-containing protein 4-like n=1 Tax=Aristolochia californica TaxID=171875 RepID=UPI0035D6FCAB
MASLESHNSAENFVRIPAIVQQTVELILSNDWTLKVEGAREIRRLTKTSSKHRRLFSDAIEPLVSMLQSENFDCNEAALLALLNLAVKDESNKIKIVDAGALDPLICFLQSQYSTLQEYATAALLTLSASSINKPTISASGAIPLLVQVLIEGTQQAKVDALMALYNLSTLPKNLNAILSFQAIPPLINLLKSCKKSSKTAEKCCALLESLLTFDEARTALTAEEGGVLTVVEVLEDGSAALLTLSASSINKPTISASGAIPLLVQVLIEGTQQAKVDALMALYNLSTLPKNLNAILSFQAIPPLINLLKSCKKSSKTAEKCCALLESLLTFDEARTALTAEEGGVLTVVEVLEDGSLQSREHAVGALLTMCESDRSRYREAILNEGAIPGLLELTVQGTPKAQSKARMLLQLLRDSPYPRSEFQADTLENIVSNIVSQIDGEDRCGKAKKMLAEMVQVSMEQSLRHLQQRALVCTPNELPLTSCTSEVPSK